MGPRCEVGRSQVRWQGGAGSEDGVEDDRVMEAQARCLLWTQVRGVLVQKQLGRGDKVLGAR